jgi:hypothetical protein
VFDHKRADSDVRFTIKPHDQRFKNLITQFT